MVSQSHTGGGNSPRTVAFCSRVQRGQWQNRRRVAVCAIRVVSSWHQDIGLLVTVGEDTVLNVWQASSFKDTNDDDNVVRRTLIMSLRDCKSRVDIWIRDIYMIFQMHRCSFSFQQVRKKKLSDQVQHQVFCYSNGKVCNGTWHIMLWTGKRLIQARASSHYITRLWWQTRLSFCHLLGYFLRRWNLQKFAMTPVCLVQNALVESSWHIAFPMRAFQRSHPPLSVALWCGTAWLWCLCGGIRFRQTLEQTAQLI